jgi:DNA primase
LRQCFGCGAAGDVIRSAELFDKVSFPEAVQRLSTAERVGGAPPAAAETQAPEMGVKEKKLLARIVSCYQHTVSKDGPGNGSPAL